MKITTFEHYKATAIESMSVEDWFKYANDESYTKKVDRQLKINFIISNTTLTYQDLKQQITSILEDIN